MTLFFLILCFLASILFTNGRLHFWGKETTPLALALILFVFIQVVPGVVLVSVFDFPMSYGLHNAISDEVKIDTILLTLLSLIIVLWMLYFLSYPLDFKVDIKNAKYNKITAYFLCSVSIIIIFLKVISVNGIPLISALLGNAGLAAEQKAAILKGQTGIGGFGVGYIFQYFHLIAFSYIFLSERNRKKSLFFYFFLIIVCFYLIYDLRKFNFIYFFLFVIFLNILTDGYKIKYLILGGVLGLLALVAAFFLLGQADSGNIIRNIALRAFIGQMEGSYMIYEALTPDLSRAFWGIPFSSVWGISATDPAADVVRVFFPTAGDAWVNSNTYVLAHAWSIFGNWAVFLMPLFFVINIATFVILRNIFRRYLGVISSLIYLVLILGLRINNDFSYFLYVKASIAFFSIAIFSFLIIGLKNMAMHKK